MVERKIDTTRADLTQVFEGGSAMRILLESSTESEWVAQEAGRRRGARIMERLGL